MMIWLTGCRGMLAQAFIRQFQESKIEYVGTDIEVDLTSSSAVEDFSRSHRFTHIVNTAAYTRVDDAETDSERAAAVNDTAVRYLCEQAKRQEATLIHFSTDYVFPGVASTPYPEETEPGPRSVYGKTKLAGEQWVEPLMNKTGATGAYLLRTSWLFGPGGPNFVRTILKALLTQAEVRVVHDQRGRPTYTEDLASAVISVAGLDGRAPAASGCYHFANAGVVTWHEFTIAVAEAARAQGLHLKADRIAPTTSDEIRRPAPRPAYSVLDTSKVERALGRAARDFRLALQDYLPILASELG
jgi:dTDP-4-dehydrorhamnose reductase